MVFDKLRLTFLRQAQTDIGFQYWRYFKITDHKFKHKIQITKRAA